MYVIKMKLPSTGLFPSGSKTQGLPDRRNDFLLFENLLYLYLPSG